LPPADIEDAEIAEATSGPFMINSRSERPGMFLFVGGDNKLRLRDLRFEAVDL
jgi:hypothetical protein